MLSSLRRHIATLEILMTQVLIPASGTFSLKFKDPNFQSMYLKDFYKKLLYQVQEEYKGRKDAILNDMSNNFYSFSEIVDHITDLEIMINKDQFWEQLIGYKTCDINLLAFDGWDGNGKEILIQDQNRIYQLQMIYS